VIEFVSWVSLAAVLTSTVLCLYRLVKGPSTADQLMAYGTIGSMSLAVFCLLGLTVGHVFFEAVVPLALVSFVSVLLAARFLEAEV